MSAISNQHWRNAAIERSEVVTDAWEVTKAWAGRVADWVLFFCMIFNIIEILPGAAMALWLSNAVLGVQAVTLDIAGFGLATMASHARSNGDEQVARKATITSWILIGVMFATVTAVAIGVLYPTARPITDAIEKLLILARIGMTVVYGHIVHTLRSSDTLAIQPTQQPTHVPTQPVEDERISKLTAMVESLNSGLSDMHDTISSIQLPTQPTQVVEVPTHDLHTTVKPLQLKIGQGSTGLHLLTMAATATDTREDVQEDKAACEAVTQPSEQISYPDVPGVSAEKVRQIIDAHLSGTGWREMKGNYSQTIKPVRDAYESLHSDLHTSIQNV